ncbi:cell elongation-specific peptidoglycan D,D-transpeptidase [Atopostipes suicloacalis DSM 15692]|uniref:Cell elongation-specific peptidoglycan D,D-transpeptidase n=1 Tax=Atopostipes suicloacalis DSM 15692 TaxID=1121025 RepID=A0A1M4Y275_9LACT|nr:penicillin-binding protein 2 [Atopostipes suicloacalis]SHE99937.1 cell elongation-specific peptidoglycan D,D-transpeptidase [Atopostipes suicloacalis DSM 15692]
MENKKKNRKDRNKSHIPFRLNLLFFIIFLLFVTLITRLGYLQIIQGEEFKAEVERTESTTVRGNVPRGEIFDSRLRPLVANEAKNTIMYTRGSNTKTENMAQVAGNLAHLIDLPHTSPFQDDDSDLSERDLKDYFFATNDEMMKERIEKHTTENNISESDFSYADQLELINEAEIMDYSDHELKAIAIFTKMNSAYALSTVNIKNNEVTQDEIARVSENIPLLPGITTGTDWDRIYPQEDTLRSILGSVSSESQGIPRQQLNSYLAKGYSRNDRIGQSLLEAQYETVLRGSKSTSKTETDHSGDIITQEEIFSGSKGNNLILTIDMDFQDRVDDILLDVLSKRRGLNESVYAVAMNPKNGDILALSGKKIVNGKVKDDSLGVISNAFNMGSSVKSATVLMGYMDGALTLDNNTIVDTPMRMKGSNNISSVFNRSGSVSVNDITALQYSSNIYMAQIALRMGGYWNYQQDQGVPIDYVDTVDKMRRYYSQFGLGSETGIDLPSEATGQKSTPDNAGQAMFLAFGQYDTYTPLQLAQYSATIANGGTRFAPKLVSEIRETNQDTGEVGSLVKEIEPKIMNTIDISPNLMERVQQGMYQVVNGNYGFAPGIFNSAPYVSAGKTGTAQASYWGENKSRQGESVTNITYVGYAPYDDPEIAIAVVVPYLPNQNTGTVNVDTSRKIFDAYFEVGDYKNDEPTTDEIPEDAGDPLEEE